MIAFWTASSASRIFRIQVWEAACRRRRVVPISTPPVCLVQLCTSYHVAVSSADCEAEASGSIEPKWRITADRLSVAVNWPKIQSTITFGRLIGISVWGITVENVFVMKHICSATRTGGEYKAHRFRFRSRVTTVLLFQSSANYADQTLITIRYFLNARSPRLTQSLILRGPCLSYRSTWVHIVSYFRL